MGIRVFNAEFMQPPTTRERLILTFHYCLNAGIAAAAPRLKKSADISMTKGLFGEPITARCRAWKP